MSFVLTPTELDPEGWPHVRLIRRSPGRLTLVPDRRTCAPIRVPRPGPHPLRPGRVRPRGALAADPASNWRLVDVPGSDHDQVAMSAAAQEFLLSVDGKLPRSCPLPSGDRC